MGFRAALLMDLRAISAAYINLIYANAMFHIRSALNSVELEEKKVTAQDIKLSNTSHAIPFLHPS